MTEKLRRETDTWFGPLTRMWNWFDERQIDRHVASIAIFYLTWKITAWAMGYAEAHPDKSGLEVGAVIAALMVPWSAAQAAALKFYFESRDK